MVVVRFHHLHGRPRLPGKIPRGLHIILLALVLLLFYTAWLASPMLYNGDEATYAEIAQEMVVSGNWLVPHLDGLPYLEKPPLVYWAVAASRLLFGDNEWAARLPVALSGVFGVLALFQLVRLFGDARAAFYTSACLATSFGYFLYSQVLMFDVPLTASYTAVALAFLTALRKPRWLRLMVIGGSIAVGLALMIKGLVGLAVPALAGAIVWLLWRSRLQSGRIPWRAGISTFLLITVPWHLALEIRCPNALKFYLVDQQFLRYLSRGAALDVVPVGVGPYLLTTALWFFPWVVFLPQATCGAIRDIRGNSSERDLLLVALAWAAAAVGFFVFSSARLEYYALPALPAMAILVGHWWSRSFSASASARLSLLAMAALAAFAAAVVGGVVKSDVARQLYVLLDENYRNALAGLGGDVTPSLLEIDSVLRLTALNIAVLFAAALLSLLCPTKWRPSLPFAAFLVVAVLLALSVRRGLEIFEPSRSAGPLAREAAVCAGQGDRFVAVCPITTGELSSFAFYTENRVIVDGGCQEVSWPEEGCGPTKKPEGGKPLASNRHRLPELWRANEHVFLLIDNNRTLRTASSIFPTAGYLLARSPTASMYTNRPCSITQSHTSQGNRNSGRVPSAR